MEFKLKTPDVKKPGVKVFQIKFELETVNEEFRDDVLTMILAALDGAKVGEPVQKQAALGFHKEDETDD
jgi:hypothetical protein